MTDLKPCPFCGNSQPHVYSHGSAWCVQCTCIVKRCVQCYGKTKAKAIEEWNTRADPAPRIKPLEWGEKSYFDQHADAVVEDEGHGWMIQATNPICGFNINYFIPKDAAPVYWCELSGFAEGIYAGPSLEEAKAAAETEYRNRVMSALK